VKRDRPPEERCPRRFNSGCDEASFASGAPHHTAPDLAVSAPLLSRTPTPVGSLVKDGDYRRGDDDKQGGGSRLVTTRSSGLANRDTLGQLTIAYF
ncbi:hypothetical protein M9458_053791, partial [Cirrhinus mrigala]